MDEKSCVTFLLCDPGWYVQRTWCPEWMGRKHATHTAAYVSKLIIQWFVHLPQAAIFAFCLRHDWSRRGTPKNCYNEWNNRRNDPIVSLLGLQVITSSPEPAPHTQHYSIILWPWTNDLLLAFSNDDRYGESRCALEGASGTWGQKRWPGSTVVCIFLREKTMLLSVLS